MKRQATYGRPIRQMGPAMPSGTCATSLASASPPGSAKLALRLGLMFGAVGLLGLFAPPATGQGELIEFSTQNDAQRPMAQAIGRMCPDLDAENPLVQVCGNLVNNDGDQDFPGSQLPQEELNSAVQTLNGEELQAIQQQVGDVRDNQMSLIAGRLDAIRAGLAGPGISLVGLDIDPDTKVLAAGYDEDLLIGQGDGLGEPIWERLGVFATAGGRFGDKSNTGQVVGYDFYATGLTVGADYRVRDDLVLGGAVGYSYYNVDFNEDVDNASDQKLDSNSVTFSLFGTHFFEQGLFLDGIANFGWSFYDTQRRVVVPSNNQPAVQPIDAKANGDTDAFFFGFASNVGYDFALGGFTVTPIARAQYVHADVDDYEESGASPVNLEFGDQKADSFTTNLGVEAGYAFSTAYGVIMPSIRGEYIHEFLNDNDGVRVQYASDPTGQSAFRVITEDPDRNYGLLGASVTGTLAAGWSAFADFETIVGLSEFDIYTFRAGFRKEF